MRLRRGDRARARICLEVTPRADELGRVLGAAVNHLPAERAAGGLFVEGA